MQHLGAIEGRIRGFSDCTSTSFTLYDAVHGSEVQCSLEHCDEATIAGLPGRLVVVEGFVTRDEATGRPTSIRKVRNLIVLDDVRPGSYRLARGVAPVDPGEMLPEDAIRALREG